MMPLMILTRVWQRRWVPPALFLLLLIGWLFSPIQHQLEIKQKDDAAQEYLLLSTAASAGQTLVVPATTFSGITLFTQSTLTLPTSTELTVHVRTSPESADDVRTVRRRLGDIKNGQELTFTWPAIRGTALQSYYVSISAPELVAASPLPLKYHSENSYAHGDRFVAGNKVDGDLMMRVFTRKTLIASLLTRFFERSTRAEDIYLTYEEGQRIVMGQNPYARIVGEDVRINQHYPTYFPLFYLLSAASQQLGLRDYDQWITWWRAVFLVFHVLIAMVLFILLYRENQLYLAFFSALFWLFNRWGLYVAAVGLFDFIPIFFLVVSVALIPRRWWLSGILLGVSLAIRQMALFLIPLYILWAWMAAPPNKRLRQSLLMIGSIIAVPLVTALPFLVDSSRGFAQSIALSFTRVPALHIEAPSLDAYLGLVGIPAKGLLLFLIMMVYIGVWQKKLGKYSAVMLILMAFLDFHSVFFKQYVAWVIPFIPLAASEWLKRERRTTSAHDHHR